MAESPDSGEWSEIDPYEQMLLQDYVESLMGAFGRYITYPGVTHILKPTLV